MKVRVIRLLEYVYDSPERAIEDQGRWQVGANATYMAGGKVNPTLVIRSATLPAAFVDTEEEVEQ